MRVTKLGDLMRTVSNEVQRIALREDVSVDHEQIGAVVAAASKLAAAVKAFKEKAPSGAIHALSGELDTMMKTLDNMATNPASYVSRERKHVKLAAVRENADRDSEVERIFNRLPQEHLDPHDVSMIKTQIRSKLDSDWDPNDIVMFMRNTEELNPNIGEEEALARMTRIAQRYAKPGAMHERTSTSVNKRRAQRRRASV